MYTPTEEKILSNWDTFLGYILDYVKGDRATTLYEFYNSRAERIITAPYSTKKTDVNCFPGGYIDHVNLVIECALDLHNVWSSKSSQISYTKEELIFSAINHQLGLLGTSNEEYLIPNTNDWFVKNRGEIYMFNPQVEYSTIADRSLFLLQENGIPFSFNEMLAIKLHEGLYDEANKRYFTAYLPETKIRTSLVYIINHASVMAKQIEFERDYLSTLSTSVKKQEVVQEKSTVSQKIEPQVENVIETKVSQSFNFDFDLETFFSK